MMASIQKQLDFLCAAAKSGSKLGTEMYQEHFVLVSLPDAQTCSVVSPVEARNMVARYGGNITENMALMRRP